MFGEPKAVRFQRTVRGEVALMVREEDEDNQELDSFFDYEYSPRWRDDDLLDEPIESSFVSFWDEYDDFDF